MTTVATPPPMLTAAEVADLARASRETIRRWIRSGRLRAVRVAPRGPWLIRVADLEQALRDEHAPDGGG